MIELPFSGPALVFFTIAVVLLVAPLAAERVRLPGVIGLILAGLLVGPEGLGLLARSGTIEQLGGLGLLYLMFLAGLELDLEVLSVDRRRPVIFGLLTFAIPMTLGTSSALLLGFGGLASVLIGSLWASHTLVAYPVVRRSGIVADPSVAATVGGTVITDTLALMVLAVVARLFETGAGIEFLAAMVPGVALFAVVVLWVLPRLAEWFFSGMGPDRTLRFLFVLAGLLGAAVLAEVVGIEGIVGAFLAGLALNRLVPNGGALMQRIEFVGSAILIPIFLISVGMLVDVAVVVDPETLWLSLAFIGVAMGAKWIAAETAGRIFGFKRPQIGVMFALSNAQAAATLAATVVGFELGLFDERVVNAVLILILVTITVASWVAARSAPKVDIPTPSAERLGRLILAPVANPEAAPEIVRFGMWVARADAGNIVPFHVVTTPDRERMQAAELLIGQVELLMSKLGADVEGFVRVDRSVATGVVNSVVERDASLVFLGWKGGIRARDRMFGSLLDEIVERVPCVVAACWAPKPDLKRIVLLLPADKVAPTELETTRTLCRRLAKGGGLPVVVVGEHSSDDGERGWKWVDGDLGADGLSQIVIEGDLLLFPAGQNNSVLLSVVPTLVESHQAVGFVVVYPSTSTFDLGLPAIFAGA